MKAQRMDGTQIAFVCGLVFFFVIVPMCSHNSNPDRTDGVLESAMEKMGKGLPLNEREAKRLDDISNYERKKQSEEIERRHGER
jgi:hypothetical protein